MKKIDLHVMVIVLGIIMGVQFDYVRPTSKEKLKITSSAFSQNEHIPAKYTCDGANVNPPLAIAGVPDDAKSLVLICDDPDAPSKIWVHWVVWNIPVTTKEIAENSVPGTQGMTDFGSKGYGGPCPPSGTHRYYFKLYALNITLNVSNSASKKDVENAMKGHILAQAELIGRYKRSH